MADKENTLRLIPTAVEVFERCMLRVKGARMSEKEPNWDGLAREFNLTSGNVVRSWEILSGMHPKVIEYVLTGYNDEGDKFPLNSAIQFKGETHTKQLVKVEAMIAEGDTRVSTAKNTAKAGRGSSGGSSGGRGSSGGEGREPSDEGDAAEDETPKSIVVKGPWGVRDYRAFVENKADKMPLGFQAVVKLLTKGPDALSVTERMSIPFLDEYLREAHAEPTKKAPRSKK